MYNKLVSLRNRAENAWAQVDVQLRKRYDLIPNLVEAVKGYAAHERQVFEEVTEARTAAQQAQGVQEQAQAENALTAADRPPVRRRRGLSRAPRDGELPAAPGPAHRGRGRHRRLAPGLQRHRADVRHRARDGADEHHRGHLQLPAARVLRGRGGRHPRGPSGQLPLVEDGRARAAALVAISALALLVPAAGAAQAKSYVLPQAVVQVKIAPDGSLLVREDITFSFAGSFSGAYRDIPYERESDRPRGRERGRPSLPAWRQHRAGEHRQAGHVRSREERPTRARRLALPRTRWHPDVQDRVPVPWHRGRVRRRRRREPPGVG